MKGLWPSEGATVSVMLPLLVPSADGRANIPMPLTQVLEAMELEAAHRHMALHLIAAWRREAPWLITPVLTNDGERRLLVTMAAKGEEAPIEVVIVIEERPLRRTDGDR